MHHPKVIYFCNKKIGENDEKRADTWKRLNPDYETKLYDDEMIRTFLFEEYGEIHRNIFDFLHHGPIKADFWRICILYKYGGIYSDIDNVPLVPLQEFIDTDVCFVTCSSYWYLYQFNPNFIIAEKENVILKRCIQWYVDKYANRDPYDYWEWSIMTAFTRNLYLSNYEKMDGIYTSAENMKVQIIEETRGVDHYDAHNIYKGLRVFNNRDTTWDYCTHQFKE
jgi:hypothetical protein